MKIGAAPSIRRESLTTQTARGIRDAILNGTYALGQKVREAELSARFNVSTIVIREALHILEGEGIIVTELYRGRSIFSPTPEEGEELLVMRALLESYAASLAVQKMTEPMKDRILQAARLFISEPPKTFDVLMEYELNFHGAVWEASGNRWLARELSQITLPLLVLRILGVPQKNFEEYPPWQKWQSVEEQPDNPAGHQAVARAIASGDAVAAKQMMLVHVCPRLGNNSDNSIHF